MRKDELRRVASVLRKPSSFTPSLPEHSLELSRTSRTLSHLHSYIIALYSKQLCNVTNNRFLSSF